VLRVTVFITFFLFALLFGRKLFVKFFLALVSPALAEVEQVQAEQVQRQTSGVHQQRPSERLPDGVVDVVQVELLSEKRSTEPVPHPIMHGAKMEPTSLSSGRQVPFFCRPRNRAA